ncbi:hypothetical protein LZ198_25080 [Myxococcus sp. K15C18031901]|uniref:hypothetical protein n=1 Tax=Myxococcus dinghuensis TaxID=2906761 RepID=UPI0020A6FEF8|nr:hypothetical protein [Myxococcus dinghuensis]MCP3102147.1 hypothetical protein [Myxococcus dinghuensis]
MKKLVPVLRSPMVSRALLLVAVFGVLHLLGGRQYVGVLSGTLEGGMAAMLFGITYALSWFGAVLLAPILLLAGLASLSLRRGSPTQPR